MLLFDWIACPSWYPATSVKALSGTENRVTNSSLNSYYILVWLSIWSKVQTCIWPSWCHSLSCASVKSTLVLPSTVLAHLGSPGNVCVCVSVCVWHQLDHIQTICAPCSREITTPTPRHSVFTGWMPFLPPSQQCQSTEGKRLYIGNKLRCLNAEANYVPDQLAEIPRQTDCKWCRQKYSWKLTCRCVVTKCSSSNADIKYDQSKLHWRVVSEALQSCRGQILSPARDFPTWTRTDTWQQQTADSKPCIILQPYIIHSAIFSHFLDIYTLSKHTNIRFHTFLAVKHLLRRTIVHRFHNQFVYN